MRISYNDNFFYAQVIDDGDPPFSEVMSFIQDYMLLLRDKSSHMPWYSRPLDKNYFRAEYFMHKLNHYLEGCDCGNVEIMNRDLAIAFMKKFNVGDPLHYRLIQSDNHAY